MSPAQLQGAIVDWAPFVLDDDGNLATQAVVNAYIPFDTVTDEASFQAMVAQVEAEARSVLTPEAFGVLQDLDAYMQDLAAEQLVPYGEESAFWLALEYSYGQPDFPTGGNVAAWLTPYVQQWAVARGANPGPTYVAPPPPTLTTPSQGQTVVARGAREVVSSQVPSATLTPDQAAAISAAIGVASADILKVQAAVIDAMLPNLAPGQVPQALDQLNTAATVLERQMASVLTSLNQDITGSLAAQLNGALQTLNGLAQEVNILAQDVAMKADSKIGDDVNANTTEISTLSAALATVVGTAIPDLASGLGTLTGQVGALDNTVTSQIEPQIAQNTEDIAANTDKLSGTDKDCLDQLCDAEGNVINPITEGGATPSLLKTLGSLLTKGLELGILATIMDTIITIADARVAVSAVVQDTETMSNWAESAVSVITADMSWMGPL
jgi:hypothetical protein